MGLISFILSLIAILLTIVAFFPLLGWLNWLFIPFSLIALMVNILFRYFNLGFANLAKAGMLVSLVALMVGFLRLAIGSGIF